MDYRHVAEIFLDRSGLCGDLAVVMAQAKIILSACRTTWPDIEQPAESFFVHLGEHAQHTSQDPVQALRRLHTQDLYLAWACARQDAVALAHLQTTYLRRLPTYLSNLRVTPADLDDIRQTLWIRLIIGEQKNGLLRPRIADYSGSGALGAWLRIIAVREALRLGHQAGERFERPGSELDRVASPQCDPELKLLRTRHQEDVRGAFQDALSALPPTARSLLRLHFLEGATLDQVSTLLGVSRATATRRLAEIRLNLLHEMRRLLQERLRLGEPECQSLLKALRSQFGPSLLVGLKEGERIHGPG